MGRARTTRIEQLLVAYLASEGRLNQAQIAKTLGLSQPAVSRLLSRAKGYLEPQVRFRFRQDLVEPGEMEEILRRASLKELGSRLDDVARANRHARGPVVGVFPIAEGHATKDSATRFKSFTAQAAPYVRSLLMRDSVNSCGVTWGYMLWDLSVALRSLASQRPWRPARRSIRFVPLSGDPLQDRKDQPPHLTSSNIAAELGRIANDDDYRSPWLGLVPAYIPEQFQGPDVKVIERMIHMVSAYEEIFGSGKNPGIADNLDVILTSVGPAESPLGFGRGRLLASLGRRLDELKKQIYGDIGGVLLPRNPKKPSALIQSIQRRWKGLESRHLESCARRAFEEGDPMVGRPGVVVLSLGADRAEVIFHAVERGLINHLVIDQELEKALEALVAANRR